MQKALAAIALLLLAGCEPAPQSGTLLTWEALADGKTKSYTIDGYTLSFAVREETDTTPLLRLVAPGGEEVEIPPGEGMAGITAQFAVGKLDRDSTSEQVILSTYSGGAHCCTTVQVMELADGGWKIIDLGSWDGGGLAGYPTDIDGNGYPDFVFADDRFAYAFTDYADSLMPPRIYEIRGAAAAEVSGSGRYRSLFEKDLEVAKAACLAHNNGGCAAYAADAARLGVFDAAWDAVLKNYDTASDWQYPAKCGRAKINGLCPDDAEVKFANFPEALSWFLTETGYVPAK